MMDTSRWALTTAYVYCGIEKEAGDLVPRPNTSHRTRKSFGRKEEGKGHDPI
jgi:hypothetical protein